MSLFPAYKPIETGNKQDELESMPWLRNDSCPAEISVVSVPVPVPVLEESQASVPSFTDSQRTEIHNTISIKHPKIKKHKKEKKRHSKYASSDEDFKSKKRKKKSHKRRSSDSESPERKKKKKKKHHKKHSKNSSSDSDCEIKESKENADLLHTVPTRDGESKNIFLQGPLRLSRPEDAIYLDRLPDRNNSIFCVTHFSQVASYRKLRPSSRPLGMDAWLAKKRKKKKNRYFSKSSIQFHNSVPVVKLLNEELEAEYIPLQLTYSEEQKVKKELSESKVNNLGILDSATEDYILGRQKRLTEEETTQAGDSKTLETNYWQDQIKCFNERLTKEPRNVSLWLEFIDVQDQAMPHIFADSEDKKGGRQGKNVKLLTERKIALLDSAISKNIRALELHVKRLHLGEDLWENKKLTLEWNKLVSNFPNDMNMWHHYLIFHQTYFSMFQLERVVQAYFKCLERLVQMQQGTFLSHKPPEHIGYHLIDLTTQLAFIWYQGGYMERSIALFQALVEFNVFCPSQLRAESVGKDERLAIFEAFWDSKAPRFGEADSVGWATFMERREPVSFPEEILEGTQDEEDEILSKGGSKHELWLRLESSRELSHWLPWQQDPENCEDTERMVSFPEIKRHLFLVSSQRETFYLILRFLTFLGVSIPTRIVDEGFPFLKSSSLFGSLRLETLAHFLPTKAESDGEGVFDFPVIGPSVYKDNSEAYFTFVSEIVQRSLLLVAPFAKPKLVIILIHLITKRCLYMKQRGQLNVSVIKKYKKMIKNLLKQNEFRSDLGIYYEYAHFESCFNGHDEAFKIHSMALSLGLQENKDILTETTTNEELWRHLSSLIHSELEKEDKTLAKSVNLIFNLTSSVLLDAKIDVSENTSNGAHVLRVKKKLHSFMELKLNELINNQASEIRFVNHAVSLLSLLQLLSVGFKPACLVFEEFIERVSKIEASSDSEENEAARTSKRKTLLLNVKEKLYEDYLWLIDIAPRLTRVVSCLPMSPSSVRHILKAAVQVAPNNVFFLEKMADYQNWRDFLCGFDFHQTNDADILVIIFWLLPHIKKVMSLMACAEFGVVSSGYQLESVLQSAVSTPTGRNCPLLWRLYLRLIRATRPRQLKEVAYRAINNCPNAKCLYMDCIALVPETMADILRLMSEKGIRIRIPMEELEVLLEEEKEGLESEIEEGASGVGLREDDVINLVHATPEDPLIINESIKEEDLGKEIQNDEDLGKEIQNDES